MGKQTESMREAMKIFKVWLDQYKEEKERENEKKKIVTYKNTTNVSSTPVNSMIHKKKNQIQSKRKHNTDGNNFDDCEDDKNEKKLKKTKCANVLKEKIGKSNNSHSERRN